MISSISSRYVKVLFDLDRSKGYLTNRLDDFTLIINILKNNPKLVKFLKSPQVTLKDKITVLQNAFKENFDQTLLQFLSYLIQKGRLSYLEHIANEYRLLVNKYFGKWEATIITAIPLDQDSETKLLNKLENMFHKKIHLNKTINPKIIGGAILMIANEMLDWSVAGRLRKLKDHLITRQV